MTGVYFIFSIMTSSSLFFHIQFVPFDVRYPPEWIHDPNGPNPRAELADVPIRETWEGEWIYMASLISPSS